MKNIMTVALVALSVFVFSGVCAADTLGNVTVNVVPKAYNGKAPAKLKFVGQIEITSVPCAFNYHWERSDGAKSAEKVIAVKRQKSNVYKVIDSWTFGAKGDKSEVSETLYVNSGNQHLSAESPKVTVNLK